MHDSIRVGDAGVEGSVVDEENDETVPNPVHTSAVTTTTTDEIQKVR